MESISEATTDLAVMKGSLRLYEALTAGADLHKIVEIGCELLKNPLLVSDLSFRILAYANPNNCANDTLQYISKNNYFPPEHIKYMSTKNNFDLVFQRSSYTVSSDGYAPDKYISLPLIVNAKRVGFVTCVLLEHSATEADFQIIDVLSKVLSSEMRVHDIASISRVRQYEYFIHELLTDGISAELLPVRIKQAELKLKQYKCLLVAALDEGAAVNEYQADFHLQLFEHSIPGSRCTMFRGNIIALVSCDIKASLNEALSESKLNELLSESNMTAGLSHVFIEIENLRTHYEEALATLKLGMRIAPNRRFNYCDEVCVYRLMLAGESAINLRSLCNTKIFEFMEYDSKHSTSYLITIYEYLRTNCNPAKAAQNLHVHRNTVDYRITQAEELFGLDFENSELRFSLHFSFKILSYLHLPPFDSSSIHI